MPGKTIVSLNELALGESGIVAGIHGGSGAVRRLEAMGVRTGKSITKKSRGLMHGPITVKIGSTVIGLGHGMAHKVMVEVVR